MWQIMKGNYTDYVMLFGDWRDAGKDNFVKRALHSKGFIFVAVCDNKPAGFLTAEKEEQGYFLSYVFIIPEKRQQGLFTEFVKKVKEVSDFIRINIAEDDEHFKNVRSVCEQQGFNESTACIVFSTDKWSDYENWQKYMEKRGSLLVEYLERQGFKTVAFSCAEKSLLKDLYDSEDNYYHNRLPIRQYFDNPAKNLSSEKSFLCTKDNKLAAYTMVTCPDDKSMIFEHISASEEFLGSGCIFLPLAAAIATVRKEATARVSYTMFEDNDAANALRKKLLTPLTSRERRFCNFIYRRDDR